MKTAFFLSLIAIAYLVVSNEDYKDQVAVAEDRACIAQKYGERTVSEVRRDGSVQCTAYTNVGHALVPRLKFAEVWAK